MDVKAEVDDIATKRDKAAAAFLFLSGMRATAFCTLPISCVDLANRTVMQFPTLGVKTKNKKAAITRLLEIPDLLEIVSEWDAYVRERLPATSPWYALTETSFGAQELSENQPGVYRIVGLGRNIKALFRKVGLPPLSPHKFRHGHAVYGLKLAKEVSDLKAVSMNLMHSSMGITDAIYAVLSDKDMQERIAQLGQSSGTELGGIDPKKLEEVVQKVLDQLQH
jgi:integrase